MLKKTIVQPYFDIVEVNVGIWLLVDLPAVKSENISLELGGDTLYIKGQMDFFTNKDEHLIALEFIEAIYELELELTSCVNKESISAHLYNGVLCIHIDYLDKVKRQIPVNMSKYYF